VVLAFLHQFPIAQLAFVFIAYWVFIVALNFGGHPYSMGSFCRVLLFDWLRVGLLNLGIIKLLFISMLKFRVELISRLIL
jgi:hypothetical protein